MKLFFYLFKTGKRVFLLWLALGLGFSVTAEDTPAPDITRRELKNDLIDYHRTWVEQNAAVAPPGEPPPNNDGSPPPAYQAIPGIQASVNSTLQNQALDENIFYLYGVSFIEPPELASVPLKTGYFSKHFAAYCTPRSSDETNAYVCNNGASSPLQHADIKPGTLIEPSRYNGAGQLAALEYIRSTVDPWAENSIQSIMGNLSDPNNQDKFVKALSRQSRLNVPVFSLLSAYSRRKPDNNNPDKPTFMEILERETSKRYTDPKWHENLNQAPQEALLKDIATMLALSVWIQKEQFKQNERLELLLSMNVLGNIHLQDMYQKTQEQGNQAATQAQQMAQPQNP